MWDEQQVANVRGLLTQFNGADEVCAVTGAKPEELDDLCQTAFGKTFEQARLTFGSQGRALLRRSLMQAALDGNTKALDMLAREQLGMGAVETRHRTMQAEKGSDQADDADDDFLAALVAKRKGGQPGAEDQGRA